MKAEVEGYMDFRYQIELPDDWCDRCRAMQKEFGENYISVDATDEEIVEYIALVYGIRGIHWLEAVGEDMSKEIVCYEIDGEEEITSVKFI